MWKPVVLVYVAGGKDSTIHTTFKCISLHKYMLSLSGLADYFVRLWTCIARISELNHLISSPWSRINLNLELTYIKACYPLAIRLDFACMGCTTEYVRWDQILAQWYEEIDAISILAVKESDICPKQTQTKADERIWAVWFHICSYRASADQFL